MKSEKLPWRKLGLGRRIKACEGAGEGSGLRSRDGEGGGSRWDQEGPDHAGPNSDPVQGLGLYPKSNWRDLKVFVQGGDGLR